MMISDADIKREFLAAGFTVKAGHEDLKPYVYEAARRILALAAAESEAMVAAERERCAAVLRYWLAGYAPDTVASHEARCLAHILDGRPAPEGPNAEVTGP